MHSSSTASPAQSESPVLPAPQALAEPAAAEASAPVEAQVSETSVDADGDGHDDNNGQFVADSAESNLREAVAALLAAATAYASVQSTSQFLLVDGYRLQFAGHDLMTLTVN